MMSILGRRCMVSPAVHRPSLVPPAVAALSRTRTIPRAFGDGRANNYNGPQNYVALDCVLGELTRADDEVVMAIVSFGREEDSIEVRAGFSQRNSAAAEALSSAPPGSSLRIKGRLAVPARAPGPYIYASAVEVVAAPASPASAALAPPTQPQPVPGTPMPPSADYRVNKKTEEAKLWESLRTEPHLWWDNRAKKTGRQPDFRKKDKSAALWVDSYNVPSDLEHYTEAIDRAGSGR